ncbi:MAG: hypothetical protein JWQ83_2087 [Lacunisphaera sp.]|nr:hypothetical protein [Lacunisphaera sp.]MDB6166947.1 hypothetical protein [Lacunisphaera sp.]
MRARPWQFIFLGVVAVAVTATVSLQYQKGRDLRDEVTQRRAAADERAKLETENKKLLASQPTAEQLAALRARQDALEQLRTQLAAMHRREDESAKAAAGAAKPAVSLLKGASVSHELWQDVGAATPEAAFETTLWAAVHGNIDSLAELLTFDAEARTEAAATFDRLPAAVQNELGTPERLIALLTAMDVPLGRASITGQAPTPTGMKVSTQLIDAEGKSKLSNFTLQSDNDRWRLQVPAAVIKKYAGWLHAPADGK